MKLKLSRIHYWVAEPVPGLEVLPVSSEMLLLTGPSRGCRRCPAHTVLRGLPPPITVTGHSPNPLLEVLLVSLVSLGEDCGQAVTCYQLLSLPRRCGPFLSNVWMGPQGCWTLRSPRSLTQHRYQLVLQPWMCRHPDLGPGFVTGQIIRLH